MLKSILLFPTSILLILLGVELSLEARHYLHGFTPMLIKPFISAKMSDDKTLKDILTKPSPLQHGPTPQFPFLSPLVSEAKPEREVRIWVASASHAIFGATFGYRFPDLLCKHLNISPEQQCSTLNSSKSGINLEKSNQVIKTLASRYNPDYIVLYQMSIDINRMSRNLNGSKSSPASKGQTSNSLINFTTAKKLLEQTSTYGHLREYVSGSVALQAPLLDQLPSFALDDFRGKLRAFITEVRNSGSTPVLTTFATSHTDYETMPYATKLKLMRYQQALSAKGWINTVKALNQTIRDTADNESIALIDLEQTLAGKSYYFLDYVHFNKQGHQAMAKSIANSLNDITENKSSYRVQDTGKINFGI